MNQFLRIVQKSALFLVLNICLISVSSVYGQATNGIFESYAILSINGGGNAFYDMAAATGNPDFQGANLGSFTSSQTLVVRGGENKTFKCNGGDIFNGRLRWRVWLTSAGPSGSFSTETYSFVSNDAGGCGGNQTWRGTGGSTNVISALTVPGNYTLEVFSEADGVPGTAFSSNFGNNFRATFNFCGSGTGALPVGNYTIPGCFPTIAAAVTYINTNGVTGTGTVQFNIASGHSEVAPPTGIALTATGNATTAIAFVKSGTGANPVINAGVGTATPASAAPDGIFSVRGSDYVTFDGITFTDGNTTNPATMEFGLGFFKAGAGDGCNFNTVRNCVFNMQRVNNAAQSLPMVDGSVGILMVNSTAIAATTALTPTNGGTLATNGTNSNNTFHSNTTNGGNVGIAIIGFAATAGVGPAPTATTFLGDLNNDIGGTSLATGNSILNFGGAASATNPSAGIRVNNQWSINISFNTVNNNNGTGVNHPFTLRGIFAQAGTSANATINNNTVTIQSAGTTNICNAIDNGIGSTAASNTVTINNNTVNVNYTTATTGSYTAINNGGTAAVVNINGNSITRVSGGDLAGTGTHVMIETGSPVSVTTNNNSITNLVRSGASGSWRIIKTTNAGDWTANNNTIDGMSWTSATSTGSIDGIYSFNNAVNVTANNNTIRNFSIPTTGTLTGIAEFGTTGTKTFQNNTINNFSTTAGGAGGFNARGVFVNTGTVIVSGNTIHSLNSTGSTGGTAGIISGIRVAGGTNVTLSSNKVYNLSSTSAAPTVSGLFFESGTTITATNNLIGDLRASAANTGNAVIGMHVTGGTTVNAFFNTVRLAATSTGTAFGSSAITASTTVALALRNNNFVNLSTPTGSGVTVAYRRSSTTLTSYAAASNNNNFFAGTPSASNVIFTDGTNTDQTIAAFRSRVAARDIASVSENPTFQSTTGADANFLNISTFVATQLESGGATISGITTDFAGNTRNVSTPDIGAFEFAGTPLDLTGPIISYTNLASILPQVSIPVSGVTITDLSGINTTSGTSPRLYFKKSTDANDATGWKFVEANGTTSPFDFTMNFALLNAGSISAGDVIQYFIVAQDNATTPNVGINSGSFAAVPSNVALTSSAFPIGGTINQFNVQLAISGLRTVCPTGCDYPSLTLAGGAFDIINNNVVTGDITLQINANLTGENGTFTLNEFAAPHTITIKPQNAATTITGSSATGIIVLNAADRVIIDGSISSTVNSVCPLVQASRDLTISNTNTGTFSSVIGVQSSGTNGANNNIIRNLILVGQAKNTTRACIGVAQILPGTGNNNNQFVNNELRQAQNGIAITGSSISNKNTGNVIRLNKIDAPGTQQIGISGIAASFEDNLIIDANTIANVLPTSTTADGFGIALGGVAISTTTFTGNEVTNYSITNNIINNINGASTYSAAGIFVCPITTAGSSNLIANNSITNTFSNGTSGDFGASILLGGGAGTTRVYHNSISMAGSKTGGNQPNFGIAVGGTNPTVDIRNNVIVNSAVSGTATTLGVGSYAIGFAYSTYTNLTLNNNSYFTSGTQAKFAKVGSLAVAAGTDVTDLAGLQTTIGQDANSISSNVVFASATDLRPQIVVANQTMSTAGADLTSFVPTDIDCTTRPSSPSLGFKQISIDACTTATGGTAATTTPTFCASGTPIVTASGYSIGLNSEYQWQSSTDNFTSNIVDISGQTNPATLSAGSITVTTSFRLRVGCTSDSTIQFSNVVTVTINPNPVVTVTPSFPTVICAGGSVQLTATGANSYTWSPAAGLSNTTGNQVIASPTVTTTYTVIGNTAGCSSLPASIVVVVEANPTIPTASSNSPVCSASQLNLSAATSTLPLYSVNPNSNVSFIDIRTTGTSVGTISDDSEHNVTIPSFTYAGTTYTTARVGNNGVLVFGATGGDINYSNRSLPAPLGANNENQSTGGLMTTGASSSLAAICAFWDDLTPAASGTTIVTETVGDKYVVQWTNQDSFSATGTGTITFQIQLDLSTQQIHLVYPDVSFGVASFDLGTNATVGLNYSASSALQYSNLTTSLFSGQSITFTPNVVSYSWTGPNGFTSTAQNPTISNATVAMSGTYQVSVTNPSTGCFVTSSTNVTVNPAAVAGTVSASQTICSGSTPADITVTGSVGTIQWQESLDNSLFSNISGQTSATLSGATIGALTGTRFYRAVVSGLAPCTPVNSAVVTVSVNDTTVAGAASSNQTICTSTQPADITLTGNTGTIQWQVSSDNNIFANISGATAATLTSAQMGTLTATRYYRAVVTNGVCSSENSNVVTVTVNELTVPTFNPVAAVCYNTTIPALPTTSNNGITGSWSPALNNLATTMYTFTPDAGQCADIATLQIVVNATTWNGTAWSNGAPSSTVGAIFGSGTYNQAGDITTCSVTVGNGAVVTIPSGSDLTVDGPLVVLAAQGEGSVGTLTLNNNANLLQSGATNLNSGAISVKRQALLKRLDFAYWGSPVAGQTLLGFSPLTLTNRFLSFNEATNAFVIVPNVASTTFEAGRGYSIRARNDQPTAETMWEGTFTGVPNSGVYTQSITNSNQGFNLISNPYPSPIDAAAVALQTDGTLYFWIHNSLLPGQSNYASWNSSGGVAGSDGVVPNGIIQTGQGFLVRTTTGTPVTFDNSMRVGNNEGQFFRSSSERHRIWLNLYKDTEYMGQSLVGYIEDATPGVDTGFDGVSLHGGNAFTSIIDPGSKYVIQARSLPFADTDVVPMHLNVLESGNYTIAIDHVDGLFAEGQSVYLRDNLTNVVHNLSEGAYTFASELGSFDSRFEIVYVATPLSVDNPSMDPNAVVVFKKDAQVHINSGSAVMDNVKVFDIRGRLILEVNDINASTTVLSTLRAEQQVLLIQITTTDKSVVTKKFGY